VSLRVTANGAHAEARPHAPDPIHDWLQDGSGLVPGPLL